MTVKANKTIYNINLVVIMYLASILSGCAVLNANHDDLPQYPSIVWPDSPEPSRIKFQQIIHDAKDLGIQKGFFTRLFEWVFGDDNIEIVKPMSIATLQDGTLLIADPGAGGIHRINKTNNQHDLIQLKNDQPLVTPVSLAVTGKNAYVSDSTLGIFYLNADKDYLSPVRLDVSPKRASGLAYNENTQLLYVVDTADHSVKIYKHEKLIKSFGKRGKKAGEFNYPTMAWIDNEGTLYITDSLNFRIQIFTAQGEFIKQFGKRGNGTGLQFRPKGIATDDLGHIYVVDSMFHSVQVFNKSGDFLLNFGVQGSDYGEFWLPTGIFIDRSNGITIYVADSYNKRIQVFQYIGKET